MDGVSQHERWPVLRVDDWTATRDTLHMWTQIVGKIRLAQAPMVNHWWQVPLYVSARGLTTSAMPYRNDLFEMEFDFIDHQLNIRVSTGQTRQVALAPKTVATFYAEVFEALHDLGIAVTIMARPVEVEQSIPFAQDTQHAEYRGEQAYAFWRQLVTADQLLSQFRGRFIGKCSPVHFFWGAMDLACTRFSGRTAPRHPGGAPHCADWVMVEAYSHEVASAGFWPGGSPEGSFYAYTYPEPAGYRDFPITPEAAYYDPAIQEFILPYDVVRTAKNPDALVLDFLQSTYQAAADTATWYRKALESDQ